VVPLTALADRLRADISEWSTLAGLDLVFEQRTLPITILIVAIGLALLTLTIRTLRDTGRRGHRVALPALFRQRASSASLLRHAALLFFLAGVPPFMLALADPFTTVAERHASYPGRRIAVLIDASSSMLRPFAVEQLAEPGRNRAAFFSSVTAAETFIRQRRDGKYRDMIALIEFGDEAYVITPFTTDYDNILLSTALIGDWAEFMRFPNQGTKIAAAIAEGTRLFQTFDFLNAAGNLMIIFSDGEDTQVTLHGRSINEILAGALATRIPVYLVRTNRDRQLGDIVPDGIWKPAVESTGGRFYPAANEQDVFRAIRDIDRRSPGSIEMKQYGTNQSRFAPFALLAAGLWSIGILLKLTFPYFRTFP
jgi:hypothetical protein